jgi:hypothetical protein
MAASLTSSRSVDEIHNLLLCGACNKTINEPKILSCSHSFCKACVENLATQDKGNVDGEGKKLNCPTCRSTTTFTAKNRFLISRKKKLVSRIIFLKQEFFY